MGGEALDGDGTGNEESRKKIPSLNEESGRQDPGGREEASEPPELLPRSRVPASKGNS